MSRIVALALLAPAVIFAADPSSALDCKTVYDAAVNTNGRIITVEAQCEALVEFSKCVSGFPESDLIEKELFKENSKACEPYWKAVGDPQIRTKRGNFQLTVDDLKNVNFYRHRRQEVNVFDMYEDFIKLRQQVDSLQEKVAEDITKVVNSVDDKIDALTNAQAQNEQDLKDSVANSLNTVKESVDATSASLTKRVNDVKAAVDATVATLTSDTSKAITTAAVDTQKKLDTAVGSMTESSKQLSKQLKGNVTSLTSAISEPTKHMWSGGAKSTKYGGWNDFELDRVEFDTAAPYFKKSSNTRFTALKDGLYSIKWNFRSYTHNTCYRHHQIYVNDQHVIPLTHSYMYHWQEHNVQVTWPIKAGQTFYMRALTECGNPHAYAGGGDWKEAYNRVQVTYEGKIDKKKCTSNQGLC